jgi:bifunctional ADP-heptose synthase (sugar kinase/adenylyltransferase)
VTVFYSARVTEVIQAVRPQIYVKGGDYTLESLDPGERGALEAVGARIEILELVAGKSTTAILQKISTP